ncbi:MAG TPA: DUF917 domain-containing protein [Caldilineae bacterium]|nr:DUF917 domain-containing protein [Caldilineae bacterium]
MQHTVLRTLQDCEDFLEGALWLGTGGGGGFEEGLEKLQQVLDDGLSLEWVEADEIPDDVWTVTVGLHGSIAPLSSETLEEIRNQGLTEAKDEWYVAKAVKELGVALGHDFGCVVPAELGPDSVAIPLAVGARLGIPVVDGDYIGRAVPEEAQSTYCLHGMQSNLFAGVDRWGNSVFVKKAVNTHALERMAKMLAVASYGDIAVATTPLVAAEMKKILVPGTLSRCLKIGQTLRVSRTNGRDPIDAAVEVADGWRLFDGTVESLETEDRDGYLFGVVQIKGSGAFQDQTLKVWFKNENQVTWLNGSPWICSPDLVTFVYRENGRGIYNADLKEGDEVIAVGIKGVQAFRSEQGLKLAGPRHYGFDIEYTPIEALMEK